MCGLGLGGVEEDEAGEGCNLGGEGCGCWERGEVGAQGGDRVWGGVVWGYWEGCMRLSERDTLAWKDRTNLHRRE